MGGRSGERGECAAERGSAGDDALAERAGDGDAGGGLGWSGGGGQVEGFEVHGVVSTGALEGVEEFVDFGIAGVGC
jgi:hypothetical protein